MENSLRQSKDATKVSINSDAALPAIKGGQRSAAVLSSQGARGGARLALKPDFSTMGSSKGYQSLSNKLRHSHNA